MHEWNEYSMEALYAIFEAWVLYIIKMLIMISHNMLKISHNIRITCTHYANIILLLIITMSLYMYNNIIIRTFSR